MDRGALLPDESGTMSFIPVQLVAQQESLPEVTQEVAESMDLWAIIWESGGAVLAVLILLIVASIATWFLIGYKALSTQRAKRQTRLFIDRFWATRDLDEVERVAQSLPASPVAIVFQSGYDELRKVVNENSRTDAYGMENVERAMRRAAANEATILDRFLPVLATIGSTAPFIGLFGTVWGIMKAFMEIAQLQQAGIDVVAGPIAEALIATAVGLVAAIPAVMGYNLFSNSAAQLQTETEGFIADFLNLIRRNFAE